MPRYDAGRIEPKWQAYWDEHGTFVTPNEPPRSPGNGDAAGKLYVLDMFPYPSGNGLHVGHPEGYTATDIVCRYSRMRGKHVLHPMGWDAFGLPAEQHAIKTGVHPSETTKNNINNFRRQLKMLGFSYGLDPRVQHDRPRLFSLDAVDLFRTLRHLVRPPNAGGPARTAKPTAAKVVASPNCRSPTKSVAGERKPSAVNQDRHRLAYQHEAPVNWCAALGTVLANEEVIDGKSERGGHPVTRLPLRQWMLRITAYADRLIEELNDLDWPESVKALQRNWIGKSVGAEVDFYIGQELSRLADVPGQRQLPSRAG